MAADTAAPTFAGAEVKALADIGRAEHVEKEASSHAPKQEQPDA